MRRARPRHLREPLAPPRGGGPLPATVTIDRFRKLDEYRRHPSLVYILLVETRWPSAVLYRREGGEWISETFESLSDVVALPAIAAVLPLADIYDEVAFKPGRLASGA